MDLSIHLCQIIKEENGIFFLAFLTRKICMFYSKLISWRIFM